MLNKLLDSAYFEINFEDLLDFFVAAFKIVIYLIQFRHPFNRAALAMQAGLEGMFESLDANDDTFRTYGWHCWQKRLSM